MSFENVYSNWWPEVSYYCPKTPILLVGMKMDLDKKTIDMNSIDKLVKEIQAVNYVKCSSVVYLQRCLSRLVCTSSPGY